MSADNGGYARTHLSMSEARRQWQGSPNRDTFKQLHKSQLPAYMFACDLDLVLVEKNPFGIVAYLDTKVGRDSVTYTEVIAYNQLLKDGHEVYVVQAEDEEAMKGYCFAVRPYLGGDPRPNPPAIRLGEPVPINGFAEWEAWESHLRARWKVEQTARAGKGL